jgi:Fe-S-cluster containining protein
MMTDPPWYYEGLCFECTGCGDCCTGEPGFVWVTKAEIQALADAVGLAAEAFEANFVRRVGIRKSLIELPGGDCAFFDGATRRCTVYHARPRQCRTWPFWQSNIRTPSDWAATCRACPGAGQGRVVPVEEIEAQSGVMRV